MRMSRLQMETGQIWELMVIRQRHPNLLPVEVRIRQIRDRHANIPVQKCATRKRQPVKQQAILEILTARTVIKKFPQEKVFRQKVTALLLIHRKQLQVRTEILQPHVHDAE